MLYAVPVDSTSASKWPTGNSSAASDQPMPLSYADAGTKIEIGFESPKPYEEKKRKTRKSKSWLEKRMKQPWRGRS